jgi:hypothetical protein
MLECSYEQREPQMIKMGQAKLSTTTRGTFFLTYKTSGSDLVGERSFLTIQAAVEFCRARSIKLV